MNAPIGEILAGIEIGPLPEGAIALSALVLIKAVDNDGDANWFIRWTDDLHVVEKLGALEAAITIERGRLTDWIDTGD